MPTPRHTPQAPLSRADRDLQEWLLGRLAHLTQRMSPYVEGEPQSAQFLRELMAQEVFALRAAIRIGMRAAEADLLDELVPQPLRDQLRDLGETISDFVLAPVLVKAPGASYVLGEEHQRTLVDAALGPGA
ncbi:hypothetical protein ABZ023_32140 [Streptomyces sp. NPDC006367]|uniref:hypothetical protein n=1 Tax=unclassified Streptomyces TaxID=2593676 RepID=UPI0033B33BA5